MLKDLETLEKNSKHLGDELNMVKVSADHKDQVISDQNREIEILRECLLEFSQEEIKDLNSDGKDSDERNESNKMSEDVADKRKDQLIKIGGMLKTSEVPIYVERSIATCDCLI